MDLNTPETPAFSASPQASKIKLMNLVSYFTCAVALLYALYFWLQLDAPFIAAVNLVFVVAYVIPIILSNYHHYCMARFWFFMVLLFHVFILTTQIFTANTGFHFYYLLLPTAVYLLLDDKDKILKAFIMVMGVILFFICENTNNVPMVELSVQAENWIFYSTVVVIMTEIYIVMSIFSQAISTHEKELKEMATIDSLTGIQNRRTFMSIGDEILVYSARYNKPFSVLLMDIDFFKKINDNHGHIVGDLTLTTVATQLKNSIRESDVLARYGGEEFIVLLPDTGSHAAIELAESLRESIEGLTIDITHEQHIKCTMSIGVTEFSSPTQGLIELINEADLALYQAKKNGRNRVECFSAKLT